MLPFRANSLKIQLLRGGCSHARAKDYWQESVLATLGGDQFLARRCDSWDQFVAGNCCDTESVTMGHALSRYNIILNSVPEAGSPLSPVYTQYSVTPSTICLLYSIKNNVVEQRKAANLIILSTVFSVYLLIYIFIAH